MSIFGNKKDLFEAEKEVFADDLKRLIVKQVFYSTSISIIILNQKFNDFKKDVL